MIHFESKGLFCSGIPLKIVKMEKGVIRVSETRFSFTYSQYRGSNISGEFFTLFTKISKLEKKKFGDILYLHLTGVSGKSSSFLVLENERDPDNDETEKLYRQLVDAMNAVHPEDDPTVEKVCPNCGVKAHENANFCDLCGAKIK